MFPPQADDLRPGFVGKTHYVQDSLGKPISGLIPADFESQFRGKPVKIVSVIPDQRPHRIVILLDASRSTAHKWERALYLATHLIGMPLPNTQIALVVFDKRIHGLVDIELPEAVRRYEDWTIKLCKENRERWKDAKVLNARELAPCQQ
jgi:hypothetical protein